ncbi:MAG: DUF2752 domain-containing protein, partial [Candidatus Eisenbacteria bacterium]
AARAHALGMDSVCLLRQVAHVACPTCGMTRALALLAAGDWRSALALHPWAPALAIQIVSGWALWGLALVRGAVPLERWIPRIVALNAAALILIWLARLLTGTLPPI